MNKTTIIHKDMKFEICASDWSYVYYNGHRYVISANDQDQVICLSDDEYDPDDCIRFNVYDIIVNNIFSMEDCNNPMEALQMTYECLLPMIAKLKKMVAIDKLLK